MLEFQPLLRGELCYRPTKVIGDYAAHLSCIALIYYFYHRICKESNVMLNFILFHEIIYKDHFRLRIGYQFISA